ncbi:urease accessory protein UreD [Massilia sp. SM-13]|uniref:urease accessory protein UreD n=1 Tax=Pseudoduganella rhizocola TaxID=3382643 RepID=UPI0038B542F9
MPDCSIRRSDGSPDAHAQHSAWQGRLTLGFSARDGITRLTTREHCGPLRVQKPLYPELPHVCHAIVVHPPGGVVGGDQLQIDADVGPGAHAFLTTPGAAKWYRANGRVSSQRLALAVGAGASVEWMPQEAIFFDEAQVELDQHIALAGDASYLGCEIFCLGRRASGERFTAGGIRQRTRISRGGKLLWWEQGSMTPAAIGSPLGLAGQSVCATMIAVGAPLRQDVLQSVRALSAELRFGASQIRQLLTVRYLGDDSEAARELMLAVWRTLRPHLLQREAFDPRSWRT